MVRDDIKMVKIIKGFRSGMNEYKKDTLPSLYRLRRRSTHSNISSQTTIIHSHKTNDESLLLSRVLSAAGSATRMNMTPETIIAIVGMAFNIPPVVLVMWKLWERWVQRQ